MMACDGDIISAKLRMDDDRRAVTVSSGEPPTDIIFDGSNISMKKARRIRAKRRPFFNFHAVRDSLLIYPTVGV